MLLTSEDLMLREIEENEKQGSGKRSLCEICSTSILIAQSTMLFCDVSIKSYNISKPCIKCNPRIICKHSRHLEDYKYTSIRRCNSCGCNCNCIGYIKMFKVSKWICDECLK